MVKKPTRLKKGWGLLALAAGFSMLSTTAFAGDEGNWPEYHRDARGWRFSDLNQINKQNVKKLKVAWIHQSGEITQGLQTTPLAIDGVLYYSASNNRVYAIDAVTGKEIWKYFPELDPIQQKSLFGFYNRGVSVGKGKVFIGSSDGQIIALYQKTGKELGKTQVLNL